MSATHQPPEGKTGALPTNDVESPKPTRRPKRLESEVTEAIEAWATQVKTSRQSLLKVKLSQRGKLSPAYTYLEKELNTSGNTFKTRRDILDSIIQQMIEEQIVIPGQPSIANEWRRKLLCWYESLTEEEKQSVPVFGNTISSKASLFQVDGMKNLKWARSEFVVVEQTFQDILTDLTRLGVINADYKNCKERGVEAELKKQQASPKDSLTKALAELRQVAISKHEDLVENPGRSFSKLLHIFAAASIRSKSAKGLHNYSEGFRQMTLHLTEVGFNGNEDPREYITAHYLTRFRKYLTDQMEAGLLKSLYSQGVLSAVRSMLKRAVKIRGMGLTSFIDVEGFSTARETDQYRPYPKYVRTGIQQACDKERQETNELAKDYTPFHGGSDPLGEDGYLVRGMATLENARWIFENKLNGRLISRWSADAEEKYEQAFARLLNIGGLGVAETYASWGVIYHLTSRMLAPYITRLAQVTGLNADSLKSLDIDDFVERHEITQRPYLRYWKVRSGGGKVLHLDMMYADWTWYSRAQSIEIKKIFNEVIYLTRHIRDRAEEPVKDRLFIYESQKQSEFRKVKSFENSNVINTVMNQFARDHDLKTEDGKALNISASRLRPSLVAELVELGLSIREIQVILGHKSLSATQKYLDQLEFNKTAREVNTNALIQIHKGTITRDSQPVRPTPAAATSAPIVIRTGLVSCKDALNPPDEIKKLPNYKKGSKCSLLNKCLSCSNSIITVSNLPDLFAMQWDYISIMSTSNVAETPYGAVIRENLEVLGSILTPSDHGFTAEQLDEARRLAEHIITSPLIETVSL
ncbi:site-specific integrase [Pseudomonas sp. S31]|uniref:tyrosine-type recombinase/integrase n=1 Tax=Pseudomonas sp. S31 TaxID=1564473 RepID=UPI00191164CB|nr:tyrosine-type recombinase/integrase [Pseudomonas sp. S31]MBK4998605.1 site-specific integrase [Pseudomonas sp. S31]